MKKRCRWVGTLFIALTLVSNVGCGAERTEASKKELISIFESVDEFILLRDTEGDYYYSISSNCDIERVESIIVDSVKNARIPKKKDVLSPPPGARKDAATLKFDGSKGEELIVYVNNKDLSYDMVCKLYIPGSDEQIFCFSLKREIYKDIKEIIHTGIMKRIDE